ncbi:MAG: hypothetical protein Q4Q33_10825 [Eubacteriales bacterium]|nr:hypothetical protein [Eubacteriales bacterium]
MAKEFPKPVVTAAPSTTPKKPENDRSIKKWTDMMKKRRFFFGEITVKRNWYL